ncbi:MAG: 30S ribosomal protein S18 [Candidatus Cloacimonetes bacterium 4572_55]|nr:MAG: 30S ribosomal protein S18 [Candidatus Cloacimonetes bacterium 4572_55]
MRFLIVLHDPKVRKISLKRRKRDYIKISPNMDMYIDYKRPDIIGRFLTDRGKIVPRRINGLSSKDQRKITTAIKRARFLAMLPYVDEVYR